VIAATRNRLLALGAIWGLLLAAVPALVMVDPLRLTGFLVAALACASLSGATGTLVAGRRAARRASFRNGGPKLLTSMAIGAIQGLIGGAVAALLIWALMAVTISGFSLRGPLEPSVLMSPRVFLGSFFVALSVFVYALVGGLVLGPLFGALVERVVRGKVRGKEEPVVR